MHRKVYRLGLFGTLLLLTGCVQIHNAVDDCLIELHDTWDAKLAWIRVSPAWSWKPHIRDYKFGFQRGYFDALRGKGECPPSLPPRRYWSVSNRGPDAETRITAWYNGYAEGVALAHQDGMSNRHQVALAAVIYPQTAGRPPGAWTGEPVPGEPEVESPDSESDLPPLLSVDQNYFPPTGPGVDK